MSSKGEKFYKLANQGLSNSQISERTGEANETIGARISEYRKKNNLPLPNRRGKASKWGSTGGVTNEDEIRQKNHDEITIRADGVKVCPPRFLNGYGL